MNITQETMDWAIALGINVVSAIVILVVALWIGGWIKSRIEALASRNARIDPTLFGFLASVARYTVLALAIIFILGRFGIQTTSLVALVGAAGLAIGLALQGTLTNLAAGVMIIIFRPLKAGDFVEAAGQMGTVKQITLFVTELDTLTNVRVTLPNSDIWSRAITNYSVNPTRRCDLEIGVSYDTDLKRAEQVIHEVIQADARVFQDPEPFVKVSGLGDSSVTFTVRVWCDAGDWWPLKCDLTRALKEAFDANGITIPFPTQTLIQTSDLKPGLQK